MCKVMTETEKYYHNAGEQRIKIKLCPFAYKEGYTKEQNVAMLEEAKARQDHLKVLSDAQYRNGGSLER